MYFGKSKLILVLCLLAFFVVVEAAAPEGKGKGKGKGKAQGRGKGKDKGVKILRINDEDRIVNGKNATVNQIPYIVQVVDKYAFGDSGFLCGATLISNQHIVSAAHCYGTYNADDLAVVASATYLIKDPGAIKRDVAAIFKHPQYDPETEDNDIVVIKLSEPLPLGETVKVAELCEKTWGDGEKIMVSGWGHTVENAEKHSNQLQIVKLDTVSRKKCEEEVDGITETMSCSVVSKGKDACQGDSGGPAFYQGKLCGVVSFGFGCGREAHPAVFASIPNFKQFIAESMKK